MSDELDDDHASAVLTDRTTLEEQIEDVEEACAAAGIRGLRLVTWDCDVDVPIPLIYRVSAYARLALSNAEGVEVARLSLALWGEAYDHAYGMRVYTSIDKQELTLAESPTKFIGDQAARWAEGLARLEALSGVTLPAAGMKQVLICAVAEIFRPEIAVRLLPSTG